VKIEGLWIQAEGDKDLVKLELSPGQERAKDKFSRLLSPRFPPMSQ
jgi:hypothetical protein